jgi:hypothetical protein
LHLTRDVVHEVAEDLLAERLVVMGVEDVRVPDLIDERGGLEQESTCTSMRVPAFGVTPDGHELEVLLGELLEVIQGVPVEVINAPRLLPNIALIVLIVILRCKVEKLIHVRDREEIRTKSKRAFMNFPVLW